jgi:hypothetical protein
VEINLHSPIRLNSVAWEQVYLYLLKDVKNAWSYTFTPQYVFIAWCLVKHRDNFTFYLTPNRLPKSSSIEVRWGVSETEHANGLAHGRTDRQTRLVHCAFI